jgi:hypothetical protein
MYNTCLNFIAVSTLRVYVLYHASPWFRTPVAKLRPRCMKLLSLHFVAISSFFAIAAQTDYLQIYFFL